MNTVFPWQKVLTGQCVQAIFVTFGLHRQLGFVIRAAIWLGLWFAITRLPRQWADSADQWNAAAGHGQQVWNTDFDDFHGIVWKLLLAYLFLNVIGLLAAAAGKALSLMFHHHNHFDKMQVRTLRRCAYSEAIRMSSVQCMSLTAEI